MMDTDLSVRNVNDEDISDCEDNNLEEDVDEYASISS